MQIDQRSQLPMAAGDPSPPLPSNDLATPADPAPLGSAAKAAIIVRLLLNEGADIALEQLPEDLQERLTERMGGMGLIDRATLAAVVQEFAERLDGVGLSFPKGLHAAIDALDGRISSQTAERLRRAAGLQTVGDPWPQLRDLSPDDLAQMMQAESIEVAAVLLSKLDTDKAASLLAKLPGPLARQITHAVSLTRNVTPAAVDRIGASLAEQVGAKPDLAFDLGPDARLGAILNRSSAAVRNEVLAALDETDAVFAADVKQTIFTFEHIPDRLAALDAPKVVRKVDQMAIISALGGAKALGVEATSEFLLSNISTRMADALREEVEEAGTIAHDDAEAAMTQVVDAIMQLVEDGEVTLEPPTAD